MNSFQEMPVTKPEEDGTASKTISASTPADASVSIRDSIAAKLRELDYRNAYVEANIDHGLAYQILVNRTLRGLSQEDLAKQCGGSMTKATIARLEDPEYGKHSIRTLLKLAAAFDVTLIVRFVPYSKFLDETADKSPKGLFAKSFADENLAPHQTRIDSKRNDNYLHAIKDLATEVANSDYIIRQYVIKNACYAPPFSLSKTEGCYV